MQPFKRVLNHVLRGRQVTGHGKGHSDQLKVVLAEQVRHGHRRVTGLVPSLAGPGHGGTHDNETLTDRPVLQVAKVNLGASSRRPDGVHGSGSLPSRLPSGHSQMEARHQA